MSSSSSSSAPWGLLLGARLASPGRFAALASPGAVLRTACSPGCVRPCLPCSARYAPELTAAEVKAGMQLLDTNKDGSIQLGE